MIKAVVFDWNGTLIDDLGVHLRGFRKALEGIREISEKEFYMLEGSNGINIITKLAGGLDEKEINHLHKKKMEYYQRHAPDIKLFPGAVALLRKLKADGLRLGLVTGTSRVNLDAGIRKETQAFFDHITTADEVTHPKPHPEPYLRCIQDLGVQPSEAIVVENAPLGVESAKAAGLYCIAITTTLPPSYLRKADRVVKSLGEAGNAIESMLSGKGS